jgi:hypothetical protein
MAQKTAARGRPKGTGLDDAGPLAAIADLIAANPGMKPTTAIKALGIRDPSTVRRLRDKFQQRQSPRAAAPPAGTGSNVITLETRMAAREAPSPEVAPQVPSRAARQKGDGSAKASDEHPAAKADPIPAKPDLLAAAFAASIGIGKMMIHLHYKSLWYAYQFSPYACLRRNTEFTRLVLSSLREEGRHSEVIATRGLKPA